MQSQPSAEALDRPPANPAAMKATLTTDEEILRFQNISFGFAEGTDLIRGISFSVRKGEFLTVIGRSGCGKSTLLNLAAGLLHPSHGTIWFEGTLIRQINTEVGYMTQDDTLLPWQTLFNNIALPLVMRKRPRDEIRKKVGIYMDLLDLSHAGQLYPRQLSGGMKRRALLARSLIYEPKILLLDEPFGALDASLRDDLHIELRRTVEKLDQTVIFVTHDIAEAAVLSDRVFVLGGRPLRISEEMLLPFGNGRNIAELRTSQEFSDLQRKLRLSLDHAQTL